MTHGPEKVEALARIAEFFGQPSPRSSLTETDFLQVTIPPRGSRPLSVTPGKHPVHCSNILPKGPQAVAQANGHRSRDRQIGIQLTAYELGRDSRAALNDQEKSLSTPIEAIFGVPADKLGF